LDIVRTSTTKGHQSLGNKFLKVLNSFAIILAFLIRNFYINIIKYFHPLFILYFCSFCWATTNDLIVHKVIIFHRSIFACVINHVDKQLDLLT